MMEWQPIETLSEKTTVLVFMDGDVYQASFSESPYYPGLRSWDFPFADLHGCGCCSGDRDSPTHWMPLPEPPSVETEEINK